MLMKLSLTSLVTVVHKLLRKGLLFSYCLARSL
ncbi:hypothetical protein FHR97_003376 [Halomonas stenophila]|uniref:Uncharacterized protein n=1 Tax=Halomonas stenophila TaxID=795312 RepID=A0A7W5EWZ0_9GAMM|nr:hypothetical protein [Halomonas stenophila]